MSNMRTQPFHVLRGGGKRPSQVKATTFSFVGAEHPAAAAQADPIRHPKWLLAVVAAGLDRQGLARSDPGRTLPRADSQV